MTGSLAFRKNKAAILRGEVPDKYLRLLPFIPAGDVVELGSAEGVLACLLAREGRAVTAIEASHERHASALRLANVWNVAGVRFTCADIRRNLDLLEADVLIAVRMIYYLGDELDAVFAEVAAKIPNVVLCGNKNRAAMWRQGIPNRSDKADNYYASPEGMRAVLERHGYAIVQEETEGDPIVVGRRALA